MNISRNEPCPCGSGIKFKRCCGRITDRPGLTSTGISLSISAELELLTALFHEGRYEEVESKARLLLGQYPESGLVWKLLGTALGVQGKEALAALHKAAELLPDDVDVHNNLGNALQDVGQLDGAVNCYRRALAIKPNFAKALYNLGICQTALGQFSDAITSYRRAIEIKPDYAEAHNNLGNVLKALGQLEYAIASYRRALEVDPGFADAHSNLLFALNYTASYVGSGCLVTARDFGKVAAKQALRFSSWRCDTKPERLRVGLVSGDLWKHPVSYALESVLAKLDPAHIELFAYPTSSKMDEQTTRMRPLFAAWKSIVGMTDEAAARMIHTDGVHVLLDISGHTAHNRLTMFAWKPAPVQASWLGYFATTGVAEMDYLLTSAVAVPEAHREHFTESLWYLPDIWLCFTPPELDLPLSSLPALEKGYLTFGCFQRMDKIGERVLKAWSEILSRQPSARLLLANKQLGDAGVARQFVQRLQQHDIDLERVTLRGETATRAEYFARYAEVDIVLDTFPYPGITTTCEALWMGVPTLTLLGETLMARQGAGVLVPAGLPEWVAASEADYIEQAVRFTSNLQELAKLRAGLRDRVLASPVYDSSRFARNFEGALWGMWQKWQAQQTHYL